MSLCLYARNTFARIGAQTTHPFRKRFSLTGLGDWAEIVIGHMVLVIFSAKGVKITNFVFAVEPDSSSVRSSKVSRLAYFVCYATAHFT